MSGGYFDYKNDELCNAMFNWSIYPLYSPEADSRYRDFCRKARSVNPMQDTMMSELVYDVLCLIYSLDMCLSADTSDETYRKDVDYFKKKWLSANRKSIAKREIDQSLEELREDLYKKLLVFEGEESAPMSMEENMKKAWLIVQPENSQNESSAILRTDRINAYCAENGVTIVRKGTFVTSEASPFESLDMLIKTLQLVGADIMLCYTASDIASNWTDLQEIVKKCNCEKIAVISVKEGNLSEFVKTFGGLFNAIAKTREIRIEEDDELPEGG